MSEPRSLPLPLPLPAPEPVPTHPEEMKAVFDMRIGKSISIQGSARMTPAGIVAMGITASAAALTLLALAYAWNTSRR
ncbi:hypothetical protein MKI84_08985 [Ancylobacter sp. A5.8]|uniref:hypothetical protein n=1 Tax=Ancylobacter gelatini TaxID=2919920 RepID=UPI001F4EA3B1|nr:hypothetical protein [Ancylobacter gelatini]MCJ8143051.1 hypothetical protein [Ancylobacter gelatini]